MTMILEIFLLHRSSHKFNRSIYDHSDNDQIVDFEAAGIEHGGFWTNYRLFDSVNTDVGSLILAHGPIMTMTTIQTNRGLH